MKLLRILRNMGILVAVLLVIMMMNAMIVGASPSWSNITHGAKLSSPNGIAVDSSGNLYMVDGNHNKVLELVNGAASWTDITYSAGFKLPCGLAVDSAGNLYVGDVGNNRIAKLVKGASSWTSIPVKGSNMSPDYIAVDGSGYLYVGGGSTGKVCKVDPTGNTWTDITYNCGNNSGNFYPIYGIMVDSAGNVYVSTSDPHQFLMKLDNGTTTWHCIFPIGITGMVYGMGMDSAGNLYVSAVGDIYVMPSGSGSWIELTVGDWQMSSGIYLGNYLYGLAVDSTGVLYVTESDGSRVLKITMPAPTVAALYPSNGASNMLANKPITVTFSDNITAGANMNGISLKTGGTSVPYSSSISGNTLIITPTGGLSGGASYTVTVPAGAVKFLQPLASDYSFGFTAAVPAAPTVTSPAASSLATNAAVLNGSIASDGGTNITDYGFYWGTDNTTPNKVQVGSSNYSGAFNYNLSSLTPGVTYYFKAYAANSQGTSYGSPVQSFTTPTTPTVSSSAASSVTASSAVLNGIIASNGGDNISDYGFYWGTDNTTPTKVQVGTSNYTGSFTYNLTGLSPGTTYYFKAYATNSIGTSFGTPVKSFATATPALTTLTLSGSPSLTYNGVSFSYDLSGLTLTGNDQFGAAFDITGQTITWHVVSGPASVSGHTLAINNDGTVKVTASIGSITSSNLDLTANRAVPVLAALSLSGSQSLTYNGTNLTYDLSGLTLSGTDQFGVAYSLNGQSVTWQVVSGPATVSGSTLAITNSGTVVVKATIGSITSGSLSLSVSRAAPTLTTLTLSGSPSLTYNGASFTYDLSGLTLTGADQFGAAFSITGQTIAWQAVSGPATVTSHTLTITNDGTVKVNASIGSIASNSLDLFVSRAAPTLTTLTLSGSPSLTYNGTNFTYDLSGLTLSGTDQFGAAYSLNGQSVTWQVISGPATVSGNTLAITNSGTIAVKTTIGSTTSNSLSLSVSRAAPVLTALSLSGSPSLTYNGINLDYDLTGLTLAGADQFGAAYSLSGQSVTWQVASGPATVSGSTLAITNSGTVTVSAAIGSVTSGSFALPINRAAPVLETLALSGTPSLTYNGASFTYDLSGLTLTGSDQFGAAFSLSGQTITWHVVSGPASVSSHTLTINNDGTVKVTASIGSITSSNLDLTVNRAAPVLAALSLSDSPSLTYNGTNLTYDLSGLTLSGTDQFGAAYSLSGQSVTWQVASGPATVSGNNLSISNSGTVVVKANIGSITSGSLSLPVSRAAPALTTLTLSGSPSLTYNGTSLNYDLSGLTLAGSDQFGAVYSLNGQTLTWQAVSGPATVTSHTLTITNDGTVKVNASIGSIASNSLDLSVSRAAPVLKTLALSSSPSLIYNGTNLTYNLSGLTLSGTDQFGAAYSLNGQSVTWQVISGPATVSGNTLAITNSGTIAVKATIGSITSNSLSLSVSRAAPVLTTLSLSGSSSLTYNGTNLDYDLTGLTLTGADQFGAGYSLSGQNVTWQVVSGPATVSVGTLTITSSGTVTVKAAIGSVTCSNLDLTVHRGTPVLTTLSVNGNPTLAYSGASFTYNLTGLTLAGADQFGTVYNISGQTISWQVVSGPATINGSILTITNSGTVSVKATIGSVSTSSLDFHVLVKLAKPAKPVLTNKVAAWSSVANENNGYSLQLFKNGTAAGAAVVVPHGGAINYDFSSSVSTAGIYTVAVTARGTGNYTDSGPSDSSEPQVIADTTGSTGEATLSANGLTLGNSSVINLSAGVQIATAGQVTVSGQGKSLNAYTGGNLTNVDLTAPQAIGDQSVQVAKAVLVQSDTQGQPITITNSSLNGVSLSIPNQTTIFAPSGWEGALLPPRAAASTGTAPSGYTIGGTVIDAGSTGSILLFDKPVVLVLHGVTGPVGFKLAGSNAWVRITEQAGGSYSNPTGPAFPGAAYISNGTDTKIITWHLTSFGNLVLQPTNSGQSSGSIQPPNNGQSSGTNGTAANANETAGTQTTMPESTASITVKASVDSTGKATATITTAQINEALNKVEGITQTGQQSESSKVKVELKIEASTGTNSIEASIPKAAVSKVAEGGSTALTVSAPLASITFNSDALSAISAEATADVRITAARVDGESLSSQAQQVVGDRPVYSFSVTSGNKTISQFGGSVEVSVPYTPKASEDTNAIVIYYINAQGQPEIVSNCTYDAVSGTVKFTTSHFSRYAVGYNKVTFKDVAGNAWYADAVNFIAARGIDTGIGNGKFGPDTKLTRGQFMVMLMRAYGIAPDEKPKDNFADAGHTYYTAYLATAKRLGICEGVGNNRYAPDKEITRQEMCTMLYNILKLMGKLPKDSSSGDIKSFKDADQIAPWAKDTMAALVKMGIISGSSGRIVPKAVTTKAEMAQILFNLLTKK